ncbi:MAG: DUF3793 family protein [Ruminococcaceae bacterium]|nr:DUF3793 family protein [Oscillospiraceae bacterium]
MHIQLEKELASHCAAVLMGKKPAALFTLKMTDDEAAHATALLAESGVQMAELRCKRGRTLVLAYAPRLLRQALQQTLAKKMLAPLRYPLGESLSAIIEHLRQRIAECEGFPHEIGFFLGYPPADVVGFMLYEGRRFKHCGLWKVYSNVDKAKALCAEYEHCRRLGCRHVEMGGSLQSIGQYADKAG